MSRQQSLARAIRRGNAVVFHDKLTNSLQYAYRKGSTSKWWEWAVKNRVSEDPSRERRQFKPIHLWNPRNRAATKF
jgi:hypothetical protein